MDAPDPDETPTEPVTIPHRELEPDTLRAVIEAFVLREGTDYGRREFTLAEKVDHVLRQLERDEARIVFDPASQSVSILTTKDARAAPAAGTSCRPA
jgi:hypothetical protein